MPEHDSLFPTSTPSRSTTGLPDSDTRPVLHAAARELITPGGDVFEHA
ncbi:hypothetical protein [Rhodococcus koreensis]